MARSYLVGSVLVLAGVAAGFVGCGGDDSQGGTTTGNSTTTSTGSTSGGGSGGNGGSTSTSTSTTSTTTSSSGGGSTTTSTSSGNGGAGGAGGSGTGGAGGMGSTTSSTSSGMVLDPDNDGWTLAEGDCCESDADCGSPELVNPGAFEYLGNGVDDDCDPSTSDNVPAADCGGNPLDTPTSSIELVKAMDLCQFTIENPPLPQKKWGVISSSLLLADGTPAPTDLQVGVLANYGANVLPKQGGTMASLSSGTARDEGDPGYVHPQNGPNAGQTGNYNANTQVNAPADYLAAHGGVLPSPANCPQCAGANCTKAFDSSDLRVRIRVPTNAQSFSYKFKFYTAEFPEFVCQQYNDFFITLLNTQWVPDPNANPPQTPLPADKNIAFDANGNTVSVNNAFLEVCFPPLGSPVGTCPAGTLELTGTGMGGWNGNLKDGGGTVWLTNDAPIVPGETIDIDFVIFDAGDHNVDSLVLLDRFRWNITPSTVGVHK